MSVNPRSEYEERLKGTTAHVRCRLAGRSAIRTLSNLGWYDDRLFQSLLLLAFRGILNSQVYGRSSHKLNDALRSSASSIANKIEGLSKAYFLTPGFSAEQQAADMAAHAAIDAALATDSEYGLGPVLSANVASARSASLLVSEFAHTTASTLSRNAEDFAQAASLEDVEKFADARTSMPVWLDISVPNAVLSQHLNFAAELGNAGETWSFWHDCYLGMWDGTFCDWDLATEVARIPNEVWEEGPRAVAKSIEAIQAKLDVQIALKAIPGNGVFRSPNRHGIGGNNPPSEITDIEEVAEQTNIIWAGIEDLRAEVASDAPDKKRVKAAVNAIRTGLTACLRWSAAKGDLAVDTLIKWGVPAGGTAWILANPKKIQTVIDVALKWFPFLG